jgi:phosphohistidine phosphatase
MRHGLAEPNAASGKDADRPLTLRGVGDLRRVVKAGQHAGLQPSLILCSPFRRAVESAQVSGRLLKYDGPMLLSNNLTPDSSREALWGEIRDHRDERSVLVIAHEPLLSSAVSWMLGASRVMIEFTPGMMVRIDFFDFGPEPRGVLRRIFVWDGA